VAEPALKPEPLRPIIIKKIKKGGHGAHHGGAWKVAYADFVTAMMAFFLLMWLLNATSDEQKMGISDYFDPIGVSQGATGAGGVLGGLSVKSDGVLQDVTASPTLGPPLGSEGESAEEGQGASAGHFASGQGYGEDELGEPSSKYGEDNLVQKEGKAVAAEESNLSHEEIEDMRKKVEAFDAKQLERTEMKIKQAIQDVPELKEYAEHLIVEQTPEGLRIQILDQAKKSMFPLGSSRMYAYTTKIIENVAKVVASLPNRIAVTGHTDAKQYTQRSSYTNWELSTDRANASRRVLLGGGIPLQRIFSVIGKADTDLLVKDQPFSPINRRISITLLKKSITAPKGKDGKAQGPAPDSLAAELAYYEDQERKAAEMEAKGSPPPPSPADVEAQKQEKKYKKAVEISIAGGGLAG
jgi:chemotaxis protein MotB